MLVRNEFNKFNNTATLILDSIYHYYDIKLILKSNFDVKTVRFFFYVRNVVMDVME